MTRSSRITRPMMRKWGCEIKVQAAAQVADAIREPKSLTARKGEGWEERNAHPRAM